LRPLPRRGFLAARQFHDHIAHAARFAHFKLQILLVIVALVEQANDGHTILHRLSTVLLGAPPLPVTPCGTSVATASGSSPFLQAESSNTAEQTAKAKPKRRMALPQPSGVQAS